MFQSYATSKEFCDLLILIECKRLLYCARSFQIRKDGAESCEETRAGRQHDCEILQATRQICTLNHFEGYEVASARPRSLQAKRWTCLKGKVGKPGPGGEWWGGEGRGG
jgi:hypothetical protein